MVSGFLVCIYGVRLLGIWHIFGSVVMSTTLHRQDRCSTSRGKSDHSQSGHWKITSGETLDSITCIICMYFIPGFGTTHSKLIVKFCHTSDFWHDLNFFKKSNLNLWHLRSLCISVAICSCVSLYVLYLHSLCMG